MVSADSVYFACPTHGWNVVGLNATPLLAWNSEINAMHRKKLLMVKPNNWLVM